MPCEPALQRRIMGRFSTGVTIVTTRYGAGDEEVWGMTANSFTSLSLEPPLILVTVDYRNAMYEYVQRGACFAVNILTTHQEAISRQFATRGPKDFSGIALATGETGAPILADALAYLDCRLVNTVPGGDHAIFIGEVVAGDINGGQPLLFYNGRYTRLTHSGMSEQAGDLNALEGAYEHYGCI
ncbi:MAG: flavin reductase family protein [Burkholderiales bacterium]|nr:flavin reductase family protein [Anaerolineae bacterium]